MAGTPLSSEQIPLTHAVDVVGALETLDYAHLIALSELFLEWVLDGQVGDESATKVMLWSADYEAIAAYVGPSWRATAAPTPPGIMRFLADHALSRDHAVPDQALPSLS
jgi:hypothetical protein